MRVKISVLAAVATLAMASCGGSPSASTAPSAAPSSAAAKPASSAPAASASAAASAKPAASSAASAKPAASGAASAKPAASGSAAAGGQAVKITLSYSALVPMSLPVWVANDEGIFKKNGLDVSLIYIESSKGIPAVISGQEQIANLGGPETLSAAAGGADLVTVAVDAPSYPFVMQAVPGINTMQELKGKKIGVSNFGSTSDIATRLALQNVGMDPTKDVSIIAVGSASNRLAALKSGAIQAGMSYPPDSYTLEAQGFKTIYDLGAQHQPGSTASDIMTRSWMNANKPTVQKYVDSLVDGLSAIRSDKAQAAKILGKYMKSDDQANLAKTVDYFIANVYPTYPDAKPDMYTSAQQVLAATTNPKVKGYDVSKMLDNSFVENARSRNVSKVPAPSTSAGASASAGAAASTSAGASASAKS